MTYPGIENDRAAFEENPDLLAVEQRRKEREAEFGKYVCIADLPWGTVLAATPGSALPASSVERYKWHELGYAAERDSEQGREVLLRTGTATTEEREKWTKAAKDTPKTGGPKGSDSDKRTGN
jgi:hypothetical protein